MAETAVSLALGELFQLLKEETNLLRGLRKDFLDIKDELESIQVFLKDADRRAADEADTNDAIRIWVKQVREASFCIEDVIDEYLRLIHTANPPGHGSVFNKRTSLMKTLTPRHRIASEIRDIKMLVRGINERSQRYNFQNLQAAGSSSNINDTRETRRDPRLRFLFTEETAIVGLEGQREKLTGLLLDGASERKLIAVEGMGGLGKTTLAKLVFDSQEVTTQFDCRAYIQVSQSYTVRGLLKNMMEQFRRQTEDPLPQMLHEMDELSLIEEVRKYLKDKRYLIFFDDLWKENFSDEVESAMIDNNKCSRIIITTRNQNVSNFFKKSFQVDVHKLEFLSPNNAWELFCKKAFRFQLGGQCPNELKSKAGEIVEKCKGLPLAIVAIGGLCATRPRTVTEWESVRQNLNLELSRNLHLNDLKTILSLSYDDLPYYLKPCILYCSILV